MADQKRALLEQSRIAMGWNQRELGEALGVSTRTVQRLQGARADISADNVATLAKHVHPRNRDLAAQLVAMLLQTLVGPGLEAPLSPAAPLQAAAAPSPAPRPIAHTDLVDAIVCSIADASNVAPKMVRPTVLLTLRRALKVGLDLEEASKAGALDMEEATA